jgi:hypothetical protein
LFIDTRLLDDHSRIDATVCIIGAGPAGLSLALEMERRGINAVVLESGGMRADTGTTDLTRGENVGLPHDVGPGFRSRYLGGSSNCWGGWCRPWEPWEFDRREWIPESGWPIQAAEVAPHFERAIKLLKLGPNRFDAAYWEKAIGRHDVRRIPTDPDLMYDIVAQFSPPVRFGTHYRSELKQARSVRVYLYANVVDIETDNPATTVREVKVRTLSGRTVSVSAKQFVLATGGIENARLLLSANTVEEAGLGNRKDLVGRYLMDHPRLSSGSVSFREGWRRNKLYDFKFHYQNDSVAANGTRIAGCFMLSQRIQKDEGLLNSVIWLNSIFRGERASSVESLIRMRRRVGGSQVHGATVGQDLLSLIRDPINPMLFATARLFHPMSLVEDIEVQAVVEPEPYRDSRVTLSNERDALGMRRVKVDWRLSPLTARTFNRTFELFGEQLTRYGIADVTLSPPIRDNVWPDDLVGMWHHMGTTRMSDSPESGVVDRNCRVHGLSNLYVAGSSVFSTGAANFPTTMIVTLALRLADHLADVVARPNAVALTTMAEAGA